MKTLINNNAKSNKRAWSTITKRSVSALLAFLTICAAPMSSAQVTIRSGDGLGIGVPDPNVRVKLASAQTAQFTPTGIGPVFPAAMFSTGFSANALTVNRYSTAWVPPNVGALAGAQWLSTALDPRNGWTAMYAHTFAYPSTAQADLTISYATDDNLWGIYLNGNLIHPGGAAETHGVVTTRTFTGLNLLAGNNTLYFYARNIGVSASGIIYSGRFTAQVPPAEDLVKGCCNPDDRNLVRNPTFKNGNVDFGSGFNFAASGSLAAGQYGIFNGASVVARLTPPPLPLVMDEVTNVMTSGSFLVARLTNTPTVIWKQQVKIDRGELAACVRLKPFYHHPGWPPVVVSFKFTDNYSTHTHTKSFWPLPAPGAGGWHDFTASFHPSSSPVTMEILAHSPAAIGPTRIFLGLDNVALKKKSSVPNPNLFAVTPAITNLNIGAGTYNVSLAAWPNPGPLGYYWSVTDLSTNQEVQNPPNWWPTTPGPGFNFPGYPGTGSWPPGTLSSISGTVPGKFFTNRRYRITYGMWGTCEKWQSVSWEIGFFGAAKKDGPPEIRRVRADVDARPPKGLNPDSIFEKLRPNKPPEGRSIPPTGGRGGQKTGGGVPKQGK